MLSAGSALITPSIAAEILSERLLGCLGSKHKLIRRPVESLDRLFKLILRRKERNVAPMMLLQSFCDPNRNPPKALATISAVSSALGSLLHQIRRSRIEATKSSG